MLDYHIWPWFERLSTTAFEKTHNIDLLPIDYFPRMTSWIADMWKTDAVKAVGQLFKLLLLALATQTMEQVLSLLHPITIH